MIVDIEFSTGKKIELDDIELKELISIFNSNKVNLNPFNSYPYPYSKPIDPYYLSSPFVICRNNEAQ